MARGAVRTEPGALSGKSRDAATRQVQRGGHTRRAAPVPRASHAEERCLGYALSDPWMYLCPGCASGPGRVRSWGRVTLHNSPGSQEEDAQTVASAPSRPGSRRPPAWAPRARGPDGAVARRPPHPTRVRTSLLLLPTPSATLSAQSHPPVPCRRLQRRLCRGSASPCGSRRALCRQDGARGPSQAVLPRRRCHHASPQPLPCAYGPLGPRRPVLLFQSAL